MKRFEDIGSIIGVIAIAGIAIYGKIAEYRQKNGKRRHATATEEAWPAQPGHKPASTPHAEHDRHTRNVAPDGAHGRKATHTASSTENRADTPHAHRFGEAYAAAKRPQSGFAVTGNAQQLKKGAALNTPKTSGATAETAAETAAATLGEEFDLRRAILYSEILKPRYDAYE